MDGDDIKKQALSFAKKQKKRIARELTDISKYPADETPISVFMCGSPGAGKTEYSKRLIQILEGDDKEHAVIRIDGDDLRERFEGYTGKNSYLFQAAISVIVEKIHDNALNNRQSFIFDGTLSQYDKAASNIERSLNKSRPVLIFYIYQEPDRAWQFTLAREMKEGRNIPKATFIHQFFEARRTIKRIRDEFDKRVMVFLIKKDFTNLAEEMFEISVGGPGIDSYLGMEYSKGDIEQKI